MNEKKISRMLVVFLPVLVIALTARSDCAILRIIAEDGLEEWTELSSGFSRNVFFSGNIAPMITGILCILIAVIGCVYVFSGKKEACKVALGLSFIAILSSCIPYVQGLMTNVGWRIFAVLDVEMALLCEMLLMI